MPLGVSSLPVVSGNTVLVGGYDGYLYALDIQNGSLHWRFAVGDWVSTILVPSNQSAVAIGENNRMYSVDLMDGQPHWFYESKEHILWAGASLQGDILLLGAKLTEPKSLGLLPFNVAFIKLALPEATP